MGAYTSFAQSKHDTIPLNLESKDKEKEFYIVDLQNDTLRIELEGVWLLPKIHFEDERARKEYLLTRRRVHKVYPYAVLAAERLSVVNDLLETLPNKRSRKVYLRRAQKFMEEEFADTLKSFTRSEGRILFKLIYRQTGYTVFELIKEYRSGWNAFWYNTAASMYDLTMKQKYDPIENKEDYYIEDILQNAFVENILIEQEAQVPIDLQKIYLKWEK